MKKKAVLVTGAVSGIGRDVVEALIARGHRVFGTTQHESEALRLAAEVPGAAGVFKLDITCPEDRQKIAGLELDVLINNAARAESGSLAEIDIDKVRGVFEVNVFSTLELSQVAIKGMIRRGGGTVIFMSSIAGRVPEAFLMPYSMSKFAVSAAAAGLREEMDFLGKGIRVSVIEPGPYSTGFNQKFSESRFQWMREGSLFSPQQIAEMKAKTDRQLRFGEVRSTKSLVTKIVKAVEAKKPRLRYVAPLHFAIMVRLLRAMGV
jgi:short-subunit dehydrogenase